MRSALSKPGRPWRLWSITGGCFGNIRVGGFATVTGGWFQQNTQKKALAHQGYVFPGIKRIEGHEFDVVATKDNFIYNIQCKNNLLDSAHMEQNPKLFARYNLRLDKYYAQALRKEEEREILLLTKLGLSAVKHVVLSKFPLATKNPRVMAFREISQFSSRFI